MTEVKFLHGPTVQAMMNHADSFDNGSFIFIDETERLYVKMKDKIVGITPKHRDIKDLKCKNCGQPLEPNFLHGSIIKCEYCNSCYDIDYYNTDVE